MTPRTRAAAAAATMAAQTSASASTSASPSASPHKPASQPRKPKAKPQKTTSLSPSQPPSSSASPSPPPHTKTMSADTAMPLIASTPLPLRMSYRIGRGEQGVLTFEPYKSSLLPLWRFRTVPIARQSSRDLWHRFEGFYADGDFVGMDMARKFIQMGMTRAKRYANHKGGRKYRAAAETAAAGPSGGGGEGSESATKDAGIKDEVVGMKKEDVDGVAVKQEDEDKEIQTPRPPSTREELPKSEWHPDKAEKEAASLIFKKVWERCRAHEGYQRLKKEFQRDQAEWDKRGKLKHED